MIATEVELVPASYVEALDLTSIFGRRAPLEVDLGCGDGAFLTQLARENPERNFLGIERMQGRIRSTCYKAAQQRLTNVRVLFLESSYAVRYLLPGESVRSFYLLFPDPWPKKRHHARRVMKPDFLSAIYAALEVGGEFRVATDQQDYFENIVAGAAESGLFAEAPATHAAGYPMTTFERRYHERGQPIHRVVLRKISPPR